MLENNFQQLIKQMIMAKYFRKQLFPKSHILAFEPDPFLCKYLTQNVRTNGLTQIEILPKAVWSSNTSLPFLSDGADGGRVSSVSNGISVEAVMLKQFLDRDVDFLKIDIEGNELEVLKSCSDSLKKVSKIFLEYHSFKDSNQQLSNLLKILEDNHFRYFLNSATQRTKPFAFNRSTANLKVGATVGSLATFNVTFLEPLSFISSRIEAT